MGCNIHVYTEKKNKDGKWLCTDYFSVNEYYKEELEDHDDPADANPYTHEDFYSGRDYGLFGALAGVRYETLHPDPKGIPEDASKECLADYKQWDCDAHTPSWFTLEELKLMSMQNLLENGEGLLSNFMSQLNTFLTNKYYKHQLDKMDDSDFRVVFWFDN